MKVTVGPIHKPKPDENITCSGRYVCMGDVWLVCTCCEHILNFDEL